MNVLTFEDTQWFPLLPTEVSVLLGSSDCSIHTVYTIHTYNIHNTNMHKPFSRNCQKCHSGYHPCRHLDLCSTFPLIADCAIHTLRSLNATNYYQSVHPFKHNFWWNGKGRECSQAKKLLLFFFFFFGNLPFSGSEATFWELVQRWWSVCPIVFVQNLWLRRPFYFLSPLSTLSSEYSFILYFLYYLPNIFVCFWWGF